MPIRFVRQEKIARYRDPRQELNEVRIACEMRWDPLTGHSARVAHALGFQLQPLDVQPLIDASQPTCPFCPERIFQVTPTFPADILPAGRLQRGEAVLFPNLVPYDEYSAVVVVSQAHHVPLDAFTQAQVVDAFTLCLEFVRQMQHLPRTTYPLVFWNYFPASGGTQIHPHVQVFVTDTPGNALNEELAYSLRYAQAEGRPYWEDLLREEEQLGERFVTRGAHTAWLTSFVSQSLLSDTLILFPDCHAFADLTPDALGECCAGLRQALQHLASQGVYSFNLAWFGGLAGQEAMWLHARLSPRLYLTPRLWGTDTTALQHLYQEHFMVQTPEAAAQALRQVITLEHV
jgi:UDPglucose--hexose-1-phosphate uridylyltransferase